MQDFETNFEGKQALALTIDWDKEQHLIMIGTFGDSVNYGLEHVRGVLQIKLNYQKQEILTQDFYEFDENFITLGWSEREKCKQAKKRSSGMLVEYKLLIDAVRGAKEKLGISRFRQE